MLWREHAAVVITNPARRTRKRARWRLCRRSWPARDRLHRTTRTASAFLPDAEAPAETCAAAVCRWTPLPVPGRWPAARESAVTLIQPTSPHAAVA